MGTQPFYSTSEMRILVLLVSLLAGVPSGAAALTWQTHEIHLQAALGQDEVEGVFRFRNTGDTPVRILSASPSCSCVAVQYGKEMVAPGESGEIRAAYKFNGSVGHEVKTIAVVTNDQVGHATILTLTVDIPEPLVVNPRFLFWEMGKDPAEKSVEIVATYPAQTTVGALQCSNTLFAARLQPEAAGRYRLWVKPVDLTQPSTGIIGLNVVIAGHAKVYQIFVAIK